MKYITYIHYVCILKPEFILAYIITSTFSSSLKKFLQINFFKYLFQLSQRNTYEKKNEVSFKLQIIKKKKSLRKTVFVLFQGSKRRCIVITKNSNRPCHHDLKGLTPRKKCLRVELVSLMFYFWWYASLYSQRRENIIVLIHKKESKIKIYNH